MVNMIKMRNKFKARQKKLDATAPKAGDIAPDFELLDPSGQNSVRLTDFQGKKPVALSFGSYT